MYSTPVSAATMVVAALWILPLTHCQSTITKEKDNIDVLLNPVINIQNQLTQLKETCATGYPNAPDPAPSDCSDLYDMGHRQSGVYTVYLHAAGRLVGVDVYCDMVTDGGGWTVIQRRENGAVEFYRNWESYRKGFGILDGEHWLGNDMIHMFTDAKPQELRVDMSDFNGTTAYAQYESFYLSSNATQFRLDISGYYGTAGECLGGYKGFRFSTYDQDNDIHNASCAIIYHGAWWYRSCHSCNLNGPYRQQGPQQSYADHIVWFRFRGFHYSLKKTEMKIRPLKP